MRHGRKRRWQPTNGSEMGDERMGKRRKQAGGQSKREREAAAHIERR